MAEVFFAISIILFAIGVICLLLYDDCFYRSLKENEHCINGMEGTEEDKTDQIAKLNSEIERANRGSDHGL